ncbi:hypothetical protein [Kocuria nitroreducens]|uniref:hypothetical protein n=1 Tax=Kocuria nitroreducens TaxID=3058914 RepID=UPI0036DB6C20
MISFLFLVLAMTAVLAAHTVIGRLAIAREDRVPLRELRWPGRVRTIRRSLTVLADCAPSSGNHIL